MIDPYLVGAAKWLIRDYHWAELLAFLVWVNMCIAPYVAWRVVESWLQKRLDATFRGQVN